MIVVATHQSNFDFAQCRSCFASQVKKSDEVLWFGFFVHDLLTLNCSYCRIIVVLAVISDFAFAHSSKRLECDYATYFWNSSSQACVLEDQDITGRDFFISNDFNPSTTSFEIFDNEDVEFLPRNLGEVFPKLKHLSVTDCSLADIEDDVIRTLPNLIDLCLENNEIEVVRKRTFDLIPKLTVLDLSGNLIEMLNSNVFNSLVNLQNLFLANNQIKSLNANTFSRLDKLVFLDISHNQLRTLHGTLFRHLTKLLHLKINNNKLTQIPDNIFRHNRDLMWIYLGSNSIDQISIKSFEHFEKRHDEDEGKYVMLDLKENICVDTIYDVSEMFQQLRHDLTHCGIDDESSYSF